MSGGQEGDSGEIGKNQAKISGQQWKMEFGYMPRNLDYTPCEERERVRES